MKRKLTINTLAMGNLKQRRKQYTILIIGIILAMVFSSGIPFFISCMQTSITETTKRLYGTQDEIYLKAMDVDFEKGKLDGYISNYSLAHTIGFAFKDEESNDVGTAVAWLDEKAVEMYYPFLYEGRLPEKAGEIAAERQSLMQLGFADAKLGEQITLTMKIPDGKDFSKKTEKRTYTLVGVVCNKKTAICEWRTSQESAYLPAVFVNKGEEVAVGGKELLVAFVNFDNYQSWSNEKKHDYYQFSGNTLTIGTRIHKVHNDSYEGISGTDILSTMLYSTAFAVILTLVSCLAIVNSFANNLRERKKQIGMFRAVGATKRQIISIYAREAFIISLISAPISIFISYFGVKLITKIMGDDLIFMPEVWILFAGAGLGIICVMCAALIPLIPISKSSPMQAIRNVDYTRKLRRKKIRSQKQFNVSSLLAKRNITLARSRQIIVSIILAITIIGSCYGFSAIEYELSEVGYGQYEYGLYNDDHFEEDFVNPILDFRGYCNNDVTELMSTGYFSEAVASKKGTVNILRDEFTDYELIINICSDTGSVYKDVAKGLTKENFKEKVTKNFSKNYLNVKEKYNYNSLLLTATFASIGEEYFERMKDDIVEGEINIDKLNSGEEIVLVAPQKIGIEIDDDFLEYYRIDDSNPNEVKRDYLEIQECSFKVGDELDLSIVCTSSKDKKQFVRTDRKVKIGAILKDVSGFDWEFPSFYGIGVLTTNEASQLFAPELDYNSIYLKTKNNIDDEMNSIIVPYLENISLSIPDGRLRNLYEFARDNEQSIKIGLFGIICIISLFLAICGCVVNNALTARIREGKREIGTLRAVGADLKVISSSYIKQLLSIFGWGYGIGFGLYIGGYCLFAIMNNVMEWNKELYGIKLVETFLMCAVLFILCAVNLILKIKQEMKHSIVENIREL
ncbi:MAG: ABC transporter permease [Clostridia bacterium]|nr:ABC transporter permease [Clostridia bacterium]